LKEQSEDGLFRGDSADRLVSTNEGRIRTLRSVRAGRLAVLPLQTAVFESFPQKCSDDFCLLDPVRRIPALFVDLTRLSCAPPKCGALDG
jgi:hypothetical protein